MDIKCPCCSSENLVEGIIRSSDAMPIIFVSKEDNKKIFNNKHKRINAYLCKECGYISLFADNSKN